MELVVVFTVTALTLLSATAYPSPPSNPTQLLVVSGAASSAQIESTELVTLRTRGRGSVLIAPYPDKLEGAWGLQTDTDEFLVCGGLKSVGSEFPVVDTCYELSLSSNSNSWITSSNSLQTPRVFPWGIDLNQTHWWLTGGSQLGLGDLVKSSEIFDRTTQSFVPGPDLPLEINDHCLARINETHIFLIGGNIKETPQFSRRTYFFNINTGQWTRAADLNVGRLGHSCLAFTDNNEKRQVLAAGGFTNGWSITDSTELYDPISDTWTIAASTSLPGNIAFTITTASGYLVGGTDGSDELDTIYRFNPDNLLFELMPVRLNEARSAPAVIEIV